MSILVIQFIIKQWDKSQRTQQHIEERANRPDRYVINQKLSLDEFGQRYVIDQQGDDLLGNRIKLLQSDQNTLRFDRFEVSLKNRMLHYLAEPESDHGLNCVGSLDNRWIQCQYDWRYGVDEGGFYYWLYEQVTLNIMYVDRLNDNLFMNDDPEMVVRLS